MGQIKFFSLDNYPILTYVYIMKERKKHMIKIDIRAKNVAYITIGKWVIYVDNSTGEQIIDSWEE